MSCLTNARSRSRGLGVWLTLVGLSAAVGGGVATGCGDSGGGGSGGGSATTGGGGNAPVCTETASAATRGGAIAISPDDSRVVVVNRGSKSVTVFSADYSGALPTLTRVAEIGVGSEPWQVAIDACGTKAYVVLREDQKVVEIDDLGGEPALGREVAVGSEPTSLALTPNGTKLYVANWVDGTLTVIDPGAMSVLESVDLNVALAEHPKKFLGDVKPRAALAHPRSLAITNNGDADDKDEKVYATEYFAQRTAPDASNGLNTETNKEGIVYSVKVSDNSTKLVELAPIADTSFPDGNMKATSCFPNQLQGVTINGKYAFVSSVCASPVGPIGPKNNTHPVVSVIDTVEDFEVATSTTNLDKNFNALYAAHATPDDASRRFPLIANEIAFLPQSGVGYIAANGADAVFRLQYSDSASLDSVGSTAPNPDFINLAPAGLDPTLIGQNPIGVTVANSHAFAFSANDVTRNVSIIDLAKQIVAGSDADDAKVVPSTELPGDEIGKAKLRGKHFFNTGLGRWSLNGQAWGSCQACHTDGLTDNVTWYFARGPRQSTSVDGTFSKKDPSDRRVLNWTGLFDEMADFENNTRGVSGGVGALVSAKSTPPVAADRIDLASTTLFPPAGAGGLNGSTDEVTETSVIPDWADITLYTTTIQSPKAPTNLDADKVAAGEAVFKDNALGGNCQGCHGGDKWTISRVFYKPSGATNAGLKTKTWDGAALTAAGFPASLLPATTPASQVMRFGGADPAKFDQLLCIMRPVGTFNVAPAAVGIAELRADMIAPAQGDATDGKGYNPPSLLDLQTGAPYFHAGNARTLEEAFSSTFGGHWKSLSKNANFLLQSGDIDNLVAYLLSIDGAKQTIPVPAEVGDLGGDFCAP